MIKNYRVSLPKITVGLFFGLFALLVINTCLAPKAAAGGYYPADSQHYSISSSFKDNSNNIDWGYNNPARYNCADGTAGEDAGACNTGLDSKVTQYKIFRTDHPSGPTTLVVADGCKDVNSYVGYNKTSNPNTSRPNKGSRMITVNVHQTASTGGPGGLQSSTTNAVDLLAGDPSADKGDWVVPSGSCSGIDLIVTVPASSFTPQTQHGASVETASLLIYKTGNYLGEKWFKLLYPGAGEVVGDEYGDVGNFALGRSIDDSEGLSDYTFTFQPDCNFVPGPGKMRIKVGDVDWNGWQAKAYPVSKRTKMKVTKVNGSTSKVIFEQGNLTNNSDNLYIFDVPMNEMDGNAKYIVTYSNVLQNNGIKVNLPFSEYPRIGSCPPVKPHDISKVTCDNIQGWFYYENNRAYKNFRARIQWRSETTGPNSGWKDFANDSGTRTPVDQGLPPPGVTDGNEFLIKPAGLKQLIQNDNDNHLYFKLSVRDLGSGQLYDNLDFAEINETCAGLGRPPYAANCSVDVEENIPNAPPNSVRADQWFRVNVNFKNVGTEPLNVGSFGVTHDNDDIPNSDYKWGVNSGFNTHTWNPPPNDIAPGPNGNGNGESVTITISFKASDDISTRIIDLYPDWFGVGPIGNGCPVAINSFVPFDFDPHNDSISPNDYEDPTSIGWSTHLEQDVTGKIKLFNPAVGKDTETPYTDMKIQSDTTRTLSWQRNGAFQGNLQSIPDSRAFVDPPAKYIYRYHHPYDDTYDDPTVLRNFQPGDQYCSKLSMSPATGWIGPDDVIANGASRDSPSNCERVVDRPYVRAYGNDVFAGGKFGGSGSATGGEIKTYIKRASNFANSTYGAGSGVEFAAYALGVVDTGLDKSKGFTSASSRSSLPNAPKGLTFANTGTGFGGMFADTNTVPDYFISARDTDTKMEPGIATVDVGTLPDRQQSGYKPAGGKFALNGGTNFDRRHSLFIEGDVVINNDIVYANSGGWASLGNIPSLALYVKGNIYIKNTVKNLDGLYVAQPKDDGSGSGGNIYTCAKDNGVLFADNELDPQCDTKLKVNGAFIAQQTKLLRTGGTLSDVPIITGSTDPVRYVFETFSGANEDHAAESFRLPPELYLSLPGQPPKRSLNYGDYDQILTLPPVL